MIDVEIDLNELFLDRILLAYQEAFGPFNSMTSKYDIAHRVICYIRDAGQQKAIDASAVAK